MSGNLYRISHSQVASFNRCRKQFWFRYLSGIPKPEETPNVAGCVGTGIHRAMRVLCETGDPECGARELEAYLRMPAHEIAGPGTEGHATAFEIFVRGCEAHDSIRSLDRWAELNTWAPWPKRGITVTARSDRVDRLAPEHFQIVDWKTGLYDLDDETDAQLDIGHLAARVSLGMRPATRVTAIGWNLRTGRQRVRELSRDDAVGTMRYYANVADRIRQTLEFEATPSVACAFCPWREQCPAAESVEEPDGVWFEEDWEGPEEPVESRAVPDQESR